MSREKEASSGENKSSEENNQNITENREMVTGQKITITPERKKEQENTTSTLLETPKMNLINYTNDKENKNSQKINTQLLTMCHLSDVVITSFSPRETGVRIEKSFATIIKPKVLVTKPPTTPKSVYSTPKGEMTEIAKDSSRNFISFNTPSTSQTGSVNAFSFYTASKVLKNSSMHLIDLTTPNKLRPASPYLKSALKAASIRKNPTQPVHSKLISEEVVYVSDLSSTPATNETPSSIISVSSINTPSVIEVTSDASNMGITPMSGLTTPKHLPSKNIAVSTPKRTPQSLMKRAVLTSAKKQTTTPQTNTVTPRRESLNRIPLRSALLRTPITPQNAIADKSTSQLSRRLSMSTPTRKNVATRNLLDNSPSTSKTATASLCSTKRRSSLNPISVLKNVPTSTPMADASNNAGLRTRAGCKTSPLHKIRKSVSGIPLSSHISKSRRTIVLNASTSKLTSLKDKSPQQIMSNRLVNRARKSLGISPITTRSRNNTPAARKTIETRKPALFDDKHSVDRVEEDDLSRTYIIESDEDENIKNKTEKGKAKDATFSPVKDNTINLVTTSTVSQREQQGVLEIPLDVEEITNISKNQNPSREQNVIDERDNGKKLDKAIVEADVFKDIPDDTVDKANPLVAEESFAEIINLTPIVDPEKSIEIFNSPEESSQAKGQKNFAETIDVDQHVVTTAEDTIESSIENKCKKTEVLESGFGEESMAVAKESSKTENSEELMITKGDIESVTYASEISHKDNVQDKLSFENPETQNETAQLDDLIVESTIDVAELANKNNIQNKAQLREENKIENENSNKSENNDESEALGDEPNICETESVNNEIFSEKVEETSENENCHDVESFAQIVTDSVEEDIGGIAEDKLKYKNYDKDSTPNQNTSETIDEPEALDTTSCLNATVDDIQQGNTRKGEPETVSEPEPELEETSEKENSHDVESFAQILTEENIGTDDDKLKYKNYDKDSTPNQNTSETIDEPEALDTTSCLNATVDDIQQGNTRKGEPETVSEPESELEETGEKENSHDVESFAQIVTEENIGTDDDKLIHKNYDKDSTPHQNTSETIDKPEVLDTTSCLNATVNDARQGNTCKAEPETVSEPRNESEIVETMRTECREVVEDSEKSETPSVSMTETTNVLSECETESANNVIPEVIIENIEENNTPQSDIVPVCVPIVAAKELYVESTDNDIVPDNEIITSLEVDVSQNDSVSSPKSTSELKICETECNKSEFTLRETVEDKETTNISQIVPEADTELSNEEQPCTITDSKDEPISSISLAMVENNEKENTQPIESDVTTENYVAENMLQNNIESFEIASYKTELTADALVGDEHKANIPHELISNAIADNKDATNLSILQAVVGDIGKESSSQIMPPVSQNVAAELIISESEITEDEKNTSSIIDNQEESKDEHSVYEEDEIAPETVSVTENKKEENQKSFEYKPIYEDITLEGSLIERELAEEADNADSKQPINEGITVEGYAIETHLENELLENKNINDDKTAQIGLEIKERSIETVALEEYQTETVDNFENTTKLLEEIEDILNKSDEIKQKHLNELEVAQKENVDNKPLTEEYENYTQETNLSYSSAGAEKPVSENEIEINKDLIVTENIDSSLNNAVREASNEIESEANKIKTKCPHSASENLAVESYNIDDSETKTKETLIYQYSSIETETNEELIKSTDITVTLFKSSESGVKEESTEFRKEVPENETVKQNIALEESQININIDEASNDKKNILDSAILLRTNPIQIKMDNTTCLTPKRRSTRRASQPADVPQTSTDVSFTPRRSTRRASMSAETTIVSTTTGKSIRRASISSETTIVSTPTRKSTRRASISAETNAVSTPTRKSTRRASLSAINESTSVPQIITRRRASMSVDEEINKSSATCKTPGAKTPQKQIKQKMIIPEELDEVITSTILEEEDENVMVERVCLGEIIAKEFEEIKAEIIPIVEEDVSTTGKLQQQKETAEDIDADSENLEESKSKNINKQETQKQNENLASITHEFAGPIEKSEIETAKEALTIENISNNEEIKETEIGQDSSNCPLEQVISSTTDNLSSGDPKEIQLHPVEIESCLPENVDVSDTASMQKGKY